ncbi:PREDICTED: E3 ubiquitin-protein ligase RHF1A-like isoform X2 [Populus euphratica]|uniref:RING-type E3 ubiquitin transferase n=1 Tax=Populus euphratica TaxID=75702 RepID=A0AAJ6UBC7_POPEU|nr:PREDICTED: E3 ubiquitin-protein ligase RHF1A-like isoform X2 [Populus euphratica]
MASFTLLSYSMSDAPMISAPAYSSSSSSSSLGAGGEDAFEDDACSICLDPFTPQDPATDTCCKHQYHLQCIVEWSQRSKECPICWQLLVLKDPASQELLAAVETERVVRPRNSNPASMIVHHLDEDYDVEQDSYSDDSDFDDHVMQHLSASAASRARYVCKRERHRSAGLGPSQVLVLTSPEHVSTVQQTYTSPEEGQILSYGSSVINSSTPGTPSIIIQNLSSVAPPVVNQVSTTAVNSPLKPRILFRQPPTDTPQGQGSSDMLSLSESIKSKWFAASARYKESLSKGTRGMKEKLLARNNSVKELSKEVQREMSAGIAGVARMIERMDLTSKRMGPSMSDSGFTGGTSNFSWKGKGVEQNIIAQALAKESEEIAHDTSLGASSHASATVPAQVEISHAQRGH